MAKSKKPSGRQRLNVGRYGPSAEGVQSRLRVKGIYAGETRVSTSDGRAKRKSTVLGGLSRRTEFYFDGDKRQPYNYLRYRKQQSNPFRDRLVEYGQSGKRVTNRSFKGALMRRQEINDAGRKMTTGLRIGHYEKILSDADGLGFRVRNTRFGNLYRRRHDIAPDGRERLTGRQTLAFSKFTDPIRDGTATRTKIKHLGGLINKTYEIEYAADGSMLDKTVTGRRIGIFRQHVRKAEVGLAEIKTFQIGRKGGLFQRSTEYRLDSNEKRITTRALFGLIKSVSSQPMTQEEIENRDLKQAVAQGYYRPSSDKDRSIRRWVEETSRAASRSGDRESEREFDERSNAPSEAEYDADFEEIGSDDGSASHASKHSGRTGNHEFEDDRFSDMGSRVEHDQDFGEIDGDDVSQRSGRTGNHEFEYDRFSDTKGSVGYDQDFDEISSDGGSQISKHSGRTGNHEFEDDRFSDTKGSVGYDQDFDEISSDGGSQISKHSGRTGNHEFEDDRLSDSFEHDKDFEEIGSDHGSRADNRFGSSSRAFPEYTFVHGRAWDDRSSEANEVRTQASMRSGSHRTSESGYYDAEANYHSSLDYSSSPETVVSESEASSSYSAPYDYSKFRGGVPAPILYDNSSRTRIVGPKRFASYEGQKRGSYSSHEGGFSRSASGWTDVRQSRKGGRTSQDSIQNWPAPIEPIVQSRRPSLPDQNSFGPRVSGPYPDARSADNQGNQVKQTRSLPESNQPGEDLGKQTYRRETLSERKLDERQASLSR